MGPGGTRDNGRGQARDARGPRNRTKESPSDPEGRGRPGRSLRKKNGAMHVLSPFCERLVAASPTNRNIHSDPTHPTLPRPSGSLFSFRGHPGAALVPRLPPAILPGPSGTLPNRPGKSALPRRDLPDDNPSPQNGECATCRSAPMRHNRRVVVAPARIVLVDEFFALLRKARATQSHRRVPFGSPAPSPAASPTARRPGEGVVSPKAPGF